MAHGPRYATYVALLLNTAVWCAAMASSFVGPWNEPLSDIDVDRARERVAGVGAEVQLDVHPDAEQHAVGGDRRLDVGHLLAGLPAGGQVLEPVLDPLHRPTEVDGRRDDGDVLAADAVLEPEPAADVVGEHPDLLHRHADLRRAGASGTCAATGSTRGS